MRMHTHMKQGTTALMRLSANAYTHEAYEGHSGLNEILEVAAKRFKDIRAVAKECPGTHFQSIRRRRKVKVNKVKRSTTALNEEKHACNMQKDGYRVVRPQPRPPDSPSFIGTASESGAVPLITKLNRFMTDS